MEKQNERGRLCLAASDQQKIVSVLREALNPYLILLFGSAVKGDMRADSDIDIAYGNDQLCEEYERFLLGQRLARLLGREVDLVDLRRSSTVMRAQIITTGSVLYCADENRRMNYFMRALKEYALLNEEREPVLRAIRERGRVYG